MKTILILQFAVTILLGSCNISPDPTSTSTTSSDTSMKFPFKELYSSKWNNNVPDSDLQVVINSYKYWQDGNMKMLASTFADSVSCYFPGGSKFNGTRDSLMRFFGKARDSIASIKLEFDEWIKLHSIDRNKNWVTLWYTEIHTYKNGKTDSAYFIDDNEVKNGKIIFFDSQKRILK